MKQRGKRIFQDILYAQCWEDPSLDRAAFSISRADTVFSITSGGCNVLAFLIDNPAKVIALDVNPFQNYLLELKIAAFGSLTHTELLEFVGVRPSGRRWELYTRLRSLLGTSSRDYWDSQREKVESGIINCGRYEHYMALLRRWLQRVMGKKLIRQFFENEDCATRALLFNAQWNNIWWKLLTRALLSRTTMSLLFSRAFFAYLDESFSFGRHFAERTRRAMTALPMKENYFLSYILLGHYYDEEHLPAYLRREHFDIIKRNIGKIEVVTDRCEHYFSTLPDASITKFNFTNIFEWMSSSAFEQLLRETYRVARDGAILTYRNLLVHRGRPWHLADQILSHKDLAQRLHEQDLSFIYRNYVVEQITKGNHQCATKYSSSLTGKRGRTSSACRI